MTPAAATAVILAAALAGGEAGGMFAGRLAPVRVDRPTRADVMRARAVLDARRAADHLPPAVRPRRGGAAVAGARWALERIAWWVRPVRPLAAPTTDTWEDTRR